jgi:hypothetical protein
VLIVEAMAQAAAILAFKTFNLKSDSDSVYYFVGIDDARFKKPVLPGDRLILKAQILRNLRGIWKFSAQALVEDTLVSEAQLLCTMRDLPANGGNDPSDRHRSQGREARPERQSRTILDHRRACRDRRGHQHRGARGDRGTHPHR